MKRKSGLSMKARMHLATESAHEEVERYKARQAQKGGAVEDKRIEGEGDDIERREHSNRKNPQGMGYKPNRHRKAMKGTGGTHSAKRRGKRGGK